MGIPNYASYIVIHKRVCEVDQELKHLKMRYLTSETGSVVFKHSKNGLEVDINKRSSCYDGDHQLGLHCESQWILDTTPEGPLCENKPDTQQPAGVFSTLDPDDKNIWSDKEKYLLKRGLELFGRSWPRLAQYVGTKNANQVKSFMKTMGSELIGRPSGSVSNFSTYDVDLDFSELIDDLDIPASMEEVIAAVSTAQPTVVVSPSKRDNSAVTSRCSSRRRKKQLRRNYCKTSNKQDNKKHKEIIQMYNAEDIKEVLADNKESDKIVLPNGEQVIRIRYETNTSDDSDVDIEVDSDSEKVEDELSVKENYSDENKLQGIKEDNVKARDSIEREEENTSLVKPQDKKQKVKEVSECASGKQVNCDKTHLYEEILITPSGKLITVIVDDRVSSSNDRGKLEGRQEYI